MKTSTRNMIASLSLLGIVLASVVGVTHLLILRVQQGDVFEPYSSLRADPLGTKAFYESLGALPALDVRRNMQPLNKLAANQDTTLFFLGSGIGDPEKVELELVEDLERVAAAGGRVVISLVPVNWSRLPKEPEMPEFMKKWAGEDNDKEKEKGESEDKEKEDSAQGRKGTG